MPIPQIHGKGLAEEKDLMPQVFSDGTAGSLTEDQRRRSVTRATKAAPAKAAVQQPSEGAPAQVQKPVQPPAVIDRLHKESGGLYGGYVFLGPDHDASEGDQMPPSNPGWRTNGVTASSLADAYGKATVISGLMQSDARVAIIILGGIWLENLDLTVPRIDLLGLGHPKIQGHVRVMPMCDDVRVTGIEIVSLNPNPALQVLAGAQAVVVPGALFDRQSLLVFDDLRVTGLATAFEFYRRVYVRDSVFTQTQKWDTTLETACVVGHAAPDDFDWSLFDNSRIRAFISQKSGDLSVTTARPQGFAIKGTARSVAQNGTVSYLIGQSGITGQTEEYYVLPNSGMRLANCEVDGTIICEGWTVEFKEGRQASGCDAPSRSGGVVAMLRGFVLFNSGGSRYGQIPARVIFDHTNTRGAMIAMFVPDPSQAVPNQWAGHVHFRKSLHIPPISGTGGVPFSSFVGAGAAEASIVDSPTCATSWVAGGVGTSLVGSCATNVAVSDLYDPYTL